MEGVRLTVNKQTSKVSKSIEHDTRKIYLPSNEEIPSNKSKHKKSRE